MAKWQIRGTYSVAKLLGTVEAVSKAQALRRADNTFIRSIRVGPGCCRYYFIPGGDRVSLGEITAEEDPS